MINTNIQQLDLRNSTKFFLIFSIIALTAFEYFFRAFYLIIPLFVYSCYLFYKKKNKLNVYFPFFLFPFFFIAIIQMMNFGTTIFVLASLYLRFFTCYYIAMIVGKSFFDIFTKIVYICAIISIPFYLIHLSGGLLLQIIENYIAPLFNALSKTDEVFNKGFNILIYNFLEYDLANGIRNSGPFWEPGMFVVFLNIALFYNIVCNKKLLNAQNFIMILALLTTYSTTGYIALMISILTYYIFVIKSRMRYLLIPFLIMGLTYLISLDFISTKIQSQMESADVQDVNRFGSFLVHLQIIKDYPFTGVGVALTEDFLANYTTSKILANGLSFVFVYYGVIGGLGYFILLFIACVRIIKDYGQTISCGICFYILLLILAFSQDITLRLLYIIIIIYGIFSISKSSIKKHKLQLLS